MMRLSNLESQKLNHGWIDVEHLLIGLIREEGAGFTVLWNMGVDTNHLLNRITSMIPPCQSRIMPDIFPQTPRVRRVIEASIREAGYWDDGYVHSSHLLIGLMQEKDGPVSEVLREYLVSVEKIRESMLDPANQIGKLRKFNKDRRLPMQIIVTVNVTPKVGDKKITNEEILETKKLILDSIHALLPAQRVDSVNLQCKEYLQDMIARDSQPTPMPGKFNIPDKDTEIKKLDSCPIDGKDKESISCGVCGVELELDRFGFFRNGNYLHTIQKWLCACCREEALFETAQRVHKEKKVFQKIVEQVHLAAMEKSMKDSSVKPECVMADMSPSNPDPLLDVEVKKNPFYRE